MQFPQRFQPKIPKKEPIKHPSPEKSAKNPTWKSEISLPNPAATPRSSHRRNNLFCILGARDRIRITISLSFLE
jgi:hypothetical protein